MIALHDYKNGGDLYHIFGDEWQARGQRLAEDMTNALVDSRLGAAWRKLRGWLVQTRLKLEGKWEEEKGRQNRIRAERAERGRAEATERGGAEKYEEVDKLIKLIKGKTEEALKLGRVLREKERTLKEKEREGKIANVNTEEVEAWRMKIDKKVAEVLEDQRNWDWVVLPKINKAQEEVKTTDSENESRNFRVL
ncbi:hypothetical protein B0T21DRAFT_452644 [Apiosordaria backusii]|uniref:Uncharacterized protein n=1 Tax=Apiosordaria backusii TaxID=314023 RepID=A0AA40B7R1_9PEZI|nr:hypothetical protein B0T21DRAFT_452644 [Apiosordaria backusii]